MSTVLFGFVLFLIGLCAYMYFLNERLRIKHRAGFVPEAERSSAKKHIRVYEDLARLSFAIALIGVFVTVLFLLQHNGLL